MSITVEIAADPITVEIVDQIVVVEEVSNDITVEIDDTPIVVDVQANDITVEIVEQTIVVESVSQPVTVEVETGTVEFTLSGTSLDELYAGFPSTSFIYNSSGVQAGTRFNSWAALMNAIALSQYGGPRSIVFEQDEVLPAGTWDLTDITFLGNGIGYSQDAAATIRVTLADGFKLDPSMSTFAIGGGITVESVSTDYIIEPPGSFNLFVSSQASIGTTTQSFIYAVAGVIAIVSRPDAGDSYITGVSGSGLAVPLGGYELIDSNGAVVAIGGGGYSVFDSQGLARGNTPFLVYSLQSPNARSSNLTLALNTPFEDMLQPNLVIGFGPLVLKISEAVGIEYAGPGGAWSITTGAEWATTIPENVMEAIDRLAMAVADIRDGTVVPPVARAIP